MTAPGSEYEELFNRMVAAPNESFAEWHSQQWLSLYFKHQPSRRPVLSESQERYLRAMGFDDREPLLEFADTSWAAVLEGQEEDVELLELADKFGPVGMAALTQARASIIRNRLLDGALVRMTAVPGQRYWAYSDGNEATFGLVDPALMERYDGPQNWRDEDWRELLSDGIAAVDPEQLAVCVVGCDRPGIVQAMKAVLADPNCPEHGYKLRVFYLAWPRHDTILPVDADLLVEPFPYESVLVPTAGQAYNEAINHFLVNPLDGADWFYEQVVAALTKLDGPHLKLTNAYSQAISWLAAVARIEGFPAWPERLSQQAGRLKATLPESILDLTEEEREEFQETRPDAYARQFADIRLAVDRRLQTQKPEELREYRNNRELVPAELRDQEEARYTAYKRDRLLRIAGNPVVEPSKPPI
ncbi:hypothetical protein [Luteimonas sp. SDU101]|uniref:hypothetical protein n=1 Tax=Luteimonas sp. SDU101 TaxID=3422593 RepID=UPI003EBC4702